MSRNRKQDRKVPIARSRTLSLSQVPSVLKAAVMQQQRGDLQEARQAYLSVLKVDPRNASARNGLGTLALLRGDFERAIKALRATVHLQPANPGFQMNLAVALDRSGALESAQEHYRRAIALDAGLRDAYHNLANTWLQSGEPMRAVAVLEECLAATGRDFHALAYLAHSLIDAGRPAEADALLDHEQLVLSFAFDSVDGFTSLDDFNALVSRFVQTHPSLVANAMSTVGGRHTGELLGDSSSPLFAFEPVIHRAVRWYLQQLPEDAAHPMVRWAPRLWKLTSWGVVMDSGGHERSHIHPNGWLSGVLYLDLPDVVGDAPDGGDRHAGWLRFGVPTPELAVRAAPQLTDYQPQYGQIRLFPSYFYHGTVPFRSKQKRVCVSFDVEPLD